MSWFFHDNFIASTCTINFVYSPKYKHSGSTIMRGEQLSAMVRKHTKADRYKISYRPLGTRISGSILFMTKMALQEATLTQLALLKSTNKILFDPNDSIVPEGKLIYADGLIAVSHEAYLDYKIRYPTIKTYLIDHHVDPRITPSDENNRKKLSIGYFGEMQNTICTKNIARRVDFVPIDTSSRTGNDWIKQIPHYTMHYVLRKRRAIDGHKPATKIFTAARCHANVLAQETEAESVYRLGRDYPYLIKGDITERRVIEMINKAKKEYLTDEWHRGLETMSRVDADIRDEEITSQFLSMIKGIR